MSGKKCPECREHTIEWDPERGIFKCLRQSCGFEKKVYSYPGMTAEEIEIANRRAKAMRLGRKSKTF